MIILIYVKHTFEEINIHLFGNRKVQDKDNLQSKYSEWQDTRNKILPVIIGPGVSS